MRVRLATHEDHGALVELAHEFYSGVGELSGLPFDGERAGFWTSRSIAQVLALIAETEGATLAGALALDVEAPRYSAELALWDIGFYVKPEHRKSRAARLLLDAAKAIATDMKLPLFVGVSSGFDVDRQEKFFARAGFQKFGAMYLMR